MCLSRFYEQDFLLETKEREGGRERKLERKRVREKDIGRGKREGNILDERDREGERKRENWRERDFDNREGEEGERERRLLSDKRGREREKNL